MRRISVWSGAVLVAVFSVALAGCGGSEGPAGQDGAPGTNGKDGVNGNDGTGGKDGVPGTPGNNGLDGTDGATGAAGKDGAPCDVSDNEDGTFTMNCPGGSAVTFGENEPPPEYLAANGARGGALYDNWWAVTGAAEPTGNHPLYPSFGAKSGADTWRCKECHGWDYLGRDGGYKSGSHYTGIKGIYPATVSLWRAFTIIKTGHGMGNAGLTDADVWDMVKFHQEETIDVGAVVHEDGTFSGLAGAGAGLYNNGIPGFDGNGKTTAAACGTCHGADGTTEIVAGFDAFPGFLANDNPREFLHKVRFGHPGSNPAMPAAAAIHGSLRDVANLSAYAQTLPPVKWTGAGGVNAGRGGQLYDNWWTVNGAAAPAGNHPMYPTDGAKSGADTWRCKECHGWDYAGRDGRYGSGSHYTGIPGLYPPKLTRWQAFTEIKTGHALGGAAMMSDADIWDVVGFYYSGLIDTRFIVKDDGSFDGNATTGATLFTGGVGGSAACSSCHGADGLNDNPGGGAGFTDFPGFLSWDNPQEFQHKVRFGQPGTAMPINHNFGITLQNVADLAKHAQTLPCGAGPVYWPNCP